MPDRDLPRRPAALLLAAVLLSAGLAAAGPGLPAHAAAPDGPVLAFGSNSSGQLGDGTTRDSAPAVAVTATGALAGRRVVAATAGGAHSCALAADGLVACWGANGEGQLGDGTTTSSAAPVAVATSGALAGRRVVAVDAGSQHTCAATADGLAFCWGANGSGRLGDGTTSGSPLPVAVSTAGVLAGQRVTGVSAGFDHTCAVTAAGRAACWGHNTSGQLGDGTAADSAVPVAVAAAAGPLAGERAVQVSAGSLFTCARTAGGRLACWGLGSAGRLGAPPPDTCAGGPCAKTPLALAGPAGAGSGVLAGRTVATVATGLATGCAATSDGRAVCWGYNEYGTVGDGTTTQRDAPVFVAAGGGPGGPAALAGRTVVQLAVGGEHACARAADGALACWGRATSGQVGAPAPTACQGGTTACALAPLLLTGRSSGTPNPLFPAYAADVAAGNAHTVVVRAVPPGPVAVLRATAQPRGRVDLAWSSAAAGPVAAYEVRWRAGTGPWSSFARRPASPRTLTLALVAGRTYAFQVRAVNAAGAGPVTGATVRTRR